MSITVVREAAISMPRIDTHAHLECTFADLRAEAASYAGQATTAQLLGSRILAIGCRELYGIDPGATLGPNGPEEIFAQAAALRARGAKEAFEYAFDQAGITLQFAFTGQLGFQQHQPHNCPLRGFSSRIRLLAYLDPYITGNDWAFTPDGTAQPFNYYESLCGLLGTLVTLDDYLDALDRTIDSWRQYGILGMKLGLAYTTGLAFDDPSLSQARAAFHARQTMTTEEIRTVQDYAVRHALLACKRQGFPVVIHTGFPIWGHGDLRQTNPMLLHNLLVDPRYRDLTFVLLHGGNPYIGETAYLAGMFPQVHIDFTWISWMDRTRFRLALAEWLEIVPHHRFCWGSDSGTPESIVGINAVVREEIAGVLEDLIARRMLDERGALTFLEQAYQQTPQRIFHI